MREIRQAQWFAQEGFTQQGSTLQEPGIKVNPHPLLGRAR